ncbi:MAG: YtxH domain-containing protein [Dehalococcoidia bacterium]
MSEHDSGKSFIIGFLMGAAIGAAVGILYAPHSGKETRAMIREKAEHAKERAEVVVAEAKEKAKEIIADAKEKATEIQNAAKN